MNKFAVVILNWNGADDTIECINSIAIGDNDAIPIIVDNGSTDDSVLKIREALRNLYGDFFEGDIHSISESFFGKYLKLPILLKSKENLGFAGGCNLGLKVARAAAIDVTLFLNNDTLVEPKSLSRLVERVRTDSGIFVAFPLLTVHGTGKIWNCGGAISKLGFRRYFHAGRSLKNISLPAEISCSFFTGCCFAIDTKQFFNRGGFCERFFFGEEDFELTLWMKDFGLKAVCLTDCIVHHKVSASITKAAGNLQASKVFVHYLNRFIHMRLRLGDFLWRLWLLCYLPYVVTLLWHRNVVKRNELIPFFKVLLRKSSVENSVTRNDFQSILRKKVW